MAVVLLAAPAVVLAGCGNSSTPVASQATSSSVTTSAAALLAATTQAVNAASSVHIEGTAASRGVGAAVSLQLTATRGSQGEGTIRIAGTTLNLLVADGTPYVKAPYAFWRGSGAGGTVAAKLADRWITAPSSGSGAGQITGMTEFVDMSKVLDPIFAAFGTPTRAGTSTVAGVRVVALTDPQGDELYVPVTGDPLPVRYLSHAAGKEGDVRYTKWNAPVHLSAPANAIDLGAIGGSG